MAESLNTETSQSILSYSLWMAKTVDYLESYLQVPFYHLVVELLLVLWIVRLLTRKSYNPKESKLELTKEEEDRLINDWQPEPLIPDTSTLPDYTKQLKVIDGKPSYRINIDGNDCLNLCTMNLLGFVGSPKVEKIAIDTLKKYGVGTCGPRGFYGTIDVHLNLEKKIANFLDVEDAILYSYGFSTISSAIPAYSKRTDVIFCDKGVNFAIQTGIVASRSKIYWFNHNDMEDLEKKLKEQQEKDKKNPKKAVVTRRFLVVEGIYTNYGDIVPLPKLVELKNEFKVRLFIDETMSFGVLGNHGKGVTEHYGIPLSEVDLIAVSLEASLGSVGGFCAGSSFVVDHQRLSGQGYCFSASLPPLLSVAAETGIKLMEEDIGMFKNLQDNSKFMREELKGMSPFLVKGADISPIIHLRLNNSYDHLTRDEEETLLQKFVDKCIEAGVGLTVSRYLNDLELHIPKASIRVTVNVNLTQEDMKSSSTTMKEIASHVFTL